MKKFAPSTKVAAEVTGAAAGDEEGEEGRAAAVEWLCSQRQCGGGSGGKVAEAVVPVGDGDGGVASVDSGENSPLELYAPSISREGSWFARGEDSEGGRRRPRP